MPYRSPERLYLNRDRSAVVPEDSPDAAFLLVGEGGMVSDDDAKRYGLRERKAKAEDERAPEPKAAEPAEAKAEADPNLITTEGAPGSTAERRTPPKR